MKSRLWLWGIAICLCATVALSSQLFAQASPQHHPRHQQYTLYDVGTFGGPISYGSFGAISLTAAGAIGWADTTNPDPYCWVDCMVGHGFLWRNGHLSDLGALPGSGNGSYAFAVNNYGLVVGVSENGAIDPVTEYPETTPVAWFNGHIYDLRDSNRRDFGGTQGYAAMVNNRGQIVGGSSNTTPDPLVQYGLSQWFPFTTQMRAFIWEGGRMQDLGTLGGPDAWASYLTDSGLVVGGSYTGATNPATGDPIWDAFLWDGRRMIDLGNFGSDWSWPAWVNNKGQVTGYSLTPGGTVHAFLWDHGRLTDLGTPGGYSSGAYWINEAGVITGFDNADAAHYGAVIWSHGNITRLGNLPGSIYCTGSNINEAQQVAGVCYDEDGSTPGFLWENGDQAALNDLVQPPSDLAITTTLQIDDRGRIVADAVDSDGNNHLVVLVPNGDCDSSCQQRIAEHQNNPRAVQPMNKRIPMPRFGKPSDVLRNPFGRVPGMPGSGAFLAH